MSNPKTIRQRTAAHISIYHQNQEMGLCYIVLLNIFTEFTIVVLPFEVYVSYHVSIPTLLRNSKSQLIYFVTPIMLKNWDSLL